MIEKGPREHSLSEKVSKFFRVSRSVISSTYACVVQHVYPSIGAMKQTVNLVKEVFPDIAHPYNSKVTGK